MGSRATVWVPKQQQTKLEATSVDGVMTGYDEQSKAYRLYCPSEKKIYISRKVEFNENPGYDIPNASPMNTNFFDLIPTGSTSDSSPAVTVLPGGVCSSPLPHLLLQLLKQSPSLHRLGHLTLSSRNCQLSIGEDPKSTLWSLYLQRLLRTGPNVIGRPHLGSNTLCALFRSLIPCFCVLLTQSTT
jgi:hypothetical protein